jgi:ParB-like chromosome segregation protein Spo0J
VTTAPSSPTLSVELVPIDDLRPDPANPRRISEEELDALERSLRQFGFVQPVLARRDDGTVIGGHQRLVAARRLGLTHVSVIWLEISVEQARLLGLALNKISGSFDDALLARLLADLQATPELDLSLSGFGEDEVRDLLRSLETREKRERVESFDLERGLEEARRAPRSKPSDLWVLRDHRLLCGDATNPDDVARLIRDADPEPPPAGRGRVRPVLRERDRAHRRRADRLPGVRHGDRPPLRRRGPGALGGVQRREGRAGRWLSQTDTIARSWRGPAARC